MEGKGIYAELAQIKNEYDKEQTKIIEKSGDPYVNSLSYTNMFLIIIIMVFLVGQMGIASIFGFNDAKNSPSKSTIFGQTGTYGLFAGETVVVALLNTIPPLLAPYIRDEKYSTKSYVTAVIMFVIGIIFQLMLQYNGLLNF